jgi:hypothetical protein
VAGWLRRLLGRPTPASPSPSPWAAPADADGPSEALWVIQPPDGVRLVSSQASRTGEGGQGIVARYSDGTTASAMVNSDGSLLILFFQGTEMVPAVPVAGVGPPRYTWQRPPART